MKARKVAQSLAWFGIGLGVLETLAPDMVARAAGLEGSERLLRVFGVREIASGAVMLAARNPGEWLWARVGGDVLDGMLLSYGMRAGNPARHRALLAMLAVLPVVVLDARFARRPTGVAWA